MPARSAGGDRRWGFFPSTSASTPASLDWRERKSQSANDPARGKGVSSFGHEEGMGEILAFGHPSDVESFDAGFGAAKAKLTAAGGAQVTVVRDEIAAPLTEAEGVAAILRY